MEFEIEAGMEVLARTPGVLRAQLSGLSEPWLRMNEGPETWSPFDVVGHLIHGEKTDWIPRSRIILAQDGKSPFESFDRFAQEEESLGKSLTELLDEFEGLRKANLEVLSGWGLTENELGLEGVHPAFGKVTLRQLLATWVVHDLGHLAQVTRTMASQYSTNVGPWRQYLGILGQTP